MNKYITTLILLASLFSGAFTHTFAQQGPTLAVTLDSQTPMAKSISAGSQNVDVARITLAASGGDVYLNGFYLATDVSGGLSNFTNIFIYDTSNDTLLGTYPNQSENPNLVQPGSAIIIGNGLSKTYLVRVSLASSANGNVRLGFSGFTYPTQTVPTLSGVPIYGNVMTLPGATPTPTPTLTPTPTPVPTSSPTPTPSSTSRPTPTSLGFTTLAAVNLSEGNTISATGSSDPDIYIVNDWGYKRLFLNPVIFGFYGHLGFSNVKNTSPSMRDMLVTSGLFRNCETNDEKVYGVEITGEDSGTLHWINTSGSQAVQDDLDFFKKVFCINNNEFSWYAQGSAYTSVNQVPNYSR